MSQELKNKIVLLQKKYPYSYAISHEFKCIKDDILQYTKFLDDTEPRMRDRVYCILNDIFESNFCKFCNIKQISVQKTFCSCSCRIQYVNENRTLEERKLQGNKIKNGHENMTDDEKLDRTFKISNTLKNRTVNEMLIVNAKRLHTYSLQSPAEKNITKLKKQATWNKRTAKERFEYSQKFSYDFVKLYKDSPKGKLPGNIYLVLFENDDEKFYKIGITSKTVEKRILAFKEYNVTLISSKILSNHNCAVLERRLHKKFKKYKYKPNLKFGGWTECFKFDDATIDMTEIFVD